jgi:BlaI family transcriptional regulator, penicillinase repressor
MGRRKRGSEPAPLTALELEIMQVLWRDGPGSVQAVQKGLRSDLAYTTIQTVLNVLHQKGRVQRELTGRAYEYRPVESKDSVAGSAIKDLVRSMFGGSSEELVMSLVKTRQLDAEKLEKLAQLMKDAEPRPGGD